MLTEIQEEINVIRERDPAIKSNMEVFLYPSILTDRYYFMQTTKKQWDFEKETGFPRTDLVYDKQEDAIFECGETHVLIPLFMGVCEEVIEHITDDAYNRQGVQRI